MQATVMAVLCFIYRAPIVVELHEVTQHVFFTHEHLGVSWLALQLVQIVLHSAVATILLLPCNCQNTKITSSMFCI